jgi:TIR domain/PASTA domain
MTASTGNVQGRIFMSYRREDTAGYAGWLYDRLASHFGRDQVFKDIDSIELGDDFIEMITTAVESCDVLLVLIGGRWLTITGPDGRRRLDNPNDFVRLEIEAALARNVRVIPILVDAAQVPGADELPPSLAKLTRRQGLELNPSRFGTDTQRLLRVLDRTVAEAQEQTRQNAQETAARQRRVEQEDAARQAGGSMYLFPPTFLLRAAHRYALNQGFYHGWPNFEFADYHNGRGTVHGCYLLRSGAFLSLQDVPKSEFQSQPILDDNSIGPVFWAGNRWAIDHGFAYGMPTFEQADHGDGRGVVYGVVLMTQDPSFRWQNIPRSELEWSPEVDLNGNAPNAPQVIMSVNRWASAHNLVAGVPNFEGTDYHDGRGQVYGAYLWPSSPIIEWRDVPEVDLLATDPGWGVVPDVLGEAVDVAKDTITRAGFNPLVPGGTRGGGSGYVTFQSPDPNTVVPLHSNVSISD